MTTKKRDYKLNLQSEKAEHNLSVKVYSSFCCLHKEYLYINIQCKTE